MFRPDNTYFGLYDSSLDTVELEAVTILGVGLENDKVNERR